MKIFILDENELSLHMAMQFEKSGHSVKVFIPPTANKSNSLIGNGLITKVTNWQAEMERADLIVLTGNSMYGAMLEPYFEKGYPIIGGNKKCNALELDREVGQKLLKQYGVKTAKFETFTDYDAAIKYVKSNPIKTFVSKPWGGTDDKDLSYVSKSAADMVFMLEHWKTEGKLGKGFMLQEKIDGYEMAVGGWFGKHGWCSAINENWEEKRQMNDGLGENCYSEDTEVLTSDGWKLFCDVTLEDKVASYHPITKEVFYENPIKLHWTEYNGPMVSFRNRYIDLLVTPTHQMFGRRRKTKNFSFFNAINTPNEVEFLQAGYTNAEDRQWYILDEYIDGNKKLHDAKLFQADLWYEFLGYYLSEGSCMPSGVITISQMPGDIKNQMKECVSKLGYTFSEFETGFKFSSVQLASYLYKFHTSRNKFIPDYIKMASIRQMNIFLDAFVLGDGDIHNGARRYTSGSYKLISDIQEMLLKFGVTGVIYTDTRTSMISPISGKTYQANPVYQIEETTRSTVGVRGFTIENYSGNIGCVTLPSTHLLFVRRNNRVVISGNTGEMGTIMRYVTSSKLFDETLEPVTDYLLAHGYIGYVDMNCIVKKDGTPAPLEFTMRFGWPHVNIAMQLHRGDFAQSLADLREGKDSMRVNYDQVSCGVVMLRPAKAKIHEMKSQPPIYNLTARMLDNVCLQKVCKAKAPMMLSDQVQSVSTLCLAGEYAAVVSDVGDTVKDACEATYKTCWKLNWPGNRAFRTDIGKHLKKHLPALQSFGYATGLEYE